MQTNHYLRDIYPLPDGGFIACGAVVPSPPDTGNQDIWILRIDSTGCEVVNCIVGIEERVGDEGIMVYPNPFSDYIKILLPNSEGLYRIRIFNVMGDEIKNDSIHGVAELKVDMRAIPKGIYFIGIEQDNRKIFAGKIIK